MYKICSLSSLCIFKRTIVSVFGVVYDHRRCGVLDIMVNQCNVYVAKITNLITDLLFSISIISALSEIYVCMPVNI